METLEQKIEALKKQHEKEARAAELFNGIKYRHSTAKPMYRDTEEYIWVHNCTPETFRDIIKRCPPEEHAYNIGDHKAKVESAYQVWIHNEIRQSKVKISYCSGIYLIFMSFDVELFSDLITRRARGVYETEFIYFEGISRCVIEKMEIPAYYPIAGITGQAFYGGDVQIDTKEGIDRFVNILMQEP